MGFETKGTYKKRYKMNIVGKDGATTTVAIPPEVIAKKAEEAGLTIEEFIQQFRVIAHYNNFDGVFYAFEPKISAGAGPEHTEPKNNKKVRSGA